MTKEEKKLLRLTQLKDDSDLAIMEHVDDLEDTFNEKVSEIKDEFKATVSELKEKTEEYRKEIPNLDAVIKSIRGQKGDDGYTPQKGKDYFTEKDIKDFLVIATPVKGKHYRDGIDGRNPIFVGKKPPTNPIKGDLWYQED